MAKGQPQQAAQQKPAAPATQATQAKPVDAGAASQNAKKVGAAVVLESGERRIDYIRRRFQEGAKRGEIAKELGVAYQIVFAATKQKKEDGAQQAQAS